MKKQKNVRAAWKPGSPLAGDEIGYGEWGDSRILNAGQVVYKVYKFAKVHKVTE